MTHSQLRLENAWHPIDGEGGGGFSFSLINVSNETITDFKLAYTSLTRTVDRPRCDNVRYLRRNANFHEFGAPEGFELKPGGTWRFKIDGLLRPARHRTDGAKSAYVTLASGKHLPVSVGDLLLDGRTSDIAPPLLPEGKLDMPFSILPWPAAVSLTPSDGVPVALFPAEGTASGELIGLVTVIDLYSRLFTASHQPFSLATVPQGLPIRFERRESFEPSAYEVEFFSREVVVAYGDPAGRQYALTALAQLVHGARSEPSKFRFPQGGRISDRPRYGWRGCHLDVSRQFYPGDDIKRLLDILAWYRMNIFHWHLTDDEAWRLEIKAFPHLTRVGATRGPDEALLPQLGNGAEAVSGFYSQEEVRSIVAHAGSLNIEVVPEIDIPGHSTATLVALPDLADGQEAPDSYRSVQGYPNNALNPAVDLTYDFLGKVFDEMVELFPSPYIHIGGDEVASNTWLASPLARKLMDEEKIDGTFGLQSYFMKKVQDMLAQRGRKLAGWDEVSHGGGVAPEGALLMAWQKPEVGIELARQGYDVVMTPGQAYYLDMAQAEAWQEPGASWAGTVPPHHTYTYEAAGDFPEDLAQRLRGLQACIWSEHFLSRDYFNHLVFPRLSAIAEAAWTPKDEKNWDRFAAIVRISPKL